ncbi:hypothetical protein D3C80_435250 [compost metagenome]
MTDKAILEVLNAKVAAVYAALAEAEAYAEEHSLEFDFGPEYGMGGTYYSEGYIESEGLRREAGWSASSHNC